MAKKNKTLVKMTSTGTMPNGALTGTYFVIKKNPKTMAAKGKTGKIEMKKYDKRIRQHVLFIEKKMPSHSA